MTIIIIFLVSVKLEGVRYFTRIRAINRLLVTGNRSVTVCEVNGRFVLDFAALLAPRS